MAVRIVIAVANIDSRSRIRDAIMLVKATNSSREMITANATGGTPTARETYTTTGTKLSNRKVGTKGISGAEIRGGTAITNLRDHTTEIMVRIDKGTTITVVIKNSSDLFRSQILTP